MSNYQRPGTCTCAHYSHNRSACETCGDPVLASKWAQRYASEGTFIGRQAVVDAARAELAEIEQFLTEVEHGDL